MNTLATYIIVVSQPLINVRKNDALRLEKKLISWLPSTRHDQTPPAYRTKLRRLLISKQRQLSSTWPTSLLRFFKFLGVIHHAQNIIIRWNCFQTHYELLPIWVSIGSITHRQTYRENTSSSYLLNSQVKRQLCIKKGWVPFKQPSLNHLKAITCQRINVWKCDRGFTKIWFPMK